jgi:hypothetical protein
MIATEIEARAHRHGMSREEFLRTAAATATAFMVLNKINGLDAWGDNAVLPVKKQHCDDLEAGRELLDRKQLVIDVQTHHIDTNANVPGAAVLVNLFCNILRFSPSDLGCPASVSQMNFIKEIFLDSQTSMAVISGLPEQIDSDDFPPLPPGFPLTPAVMAHTRDMVNDLAGSKRCLSQAMIDPKTPPGSPTSTDSLEHQVRDLGAAAIKCYTYNGEWRLDDENVAYPMYQEARRLGLKLINVHKGLPLRAFLVNSSEYVRTTDFPKAVSDNPDLNFCAYHSGFFQATQHPEGLDAGYHPENEPPNPGRWGSMEFLQQVESIPKKLRKNVYTEIGSTFAFLVQDDPLQAAHFIGRLLQVFGPKNILWGTDSIWWGSPQWLIDAFMTLEIPASLREQYGYPKLTKKMKKQILGLNAAKLYGVEKRDRKFLCTISADRFSQVQEAKGGVRSSRSLRVYGAQSRREFFALFGRKFAGMT